MNGRAYEAASRHLPAYFAVETLLNRTDLGNQHRERNRPDNRQDKECSRYTVAYSAA